MDIFNNTQFCYKYNTIHLHIDTFSGRVAVDKCCLKSQEPRNWLKSYSFDEFLQIPNIYNELDSLKNIWPTTFNTSLREFCPSFLSECDFSRHNCSQLIGIEVALDNHCNAACRFCDLHKKLNEPLKDLGLFSKMKDVYFKTLWDLRGHKLDYIRLTDTGEPFFFKNDTIQYLLSLTPDDTKEVHFNSNFFGIKVDELKSLIENLKIKIFPVISLNAWDEQSYQDIMGVGEHNFNTVIENIKYLHSINYDYQVSFILDRAENAEKLWQFIKSNQDLFSNLVVNGDCTQPEMLPLVDKYFLRTEYANRVPRDIPLE